MNIRCLGGLLTAYEMTEDEFYLEKAKDLGDRLLPAFETPTGLPRTSVNLKTYVSCESKAHYISLSIILLCCIPHENFRGASNSPRWSQGNSILADVGTLQIEFAALSRYTKEPKYQAKVKLVISFNI